MAKILDAYGRTVLSASQVDTFLDCVRKWAWRYLEGVKAPPHPSARLGTRCHTIAEAWLLKGTQPDGLEVMTLPAGRYGDKTKDYYPGQIITAGLPLLPPPGVASVESRFTFYTQESTWQGYRDAMYIQEVESGEAHAPGLWPTEWDVIPVVLDHKTTSDFKWAKSVEDLLQDTQANLYAAKTMEDFHTPHVLGRWIYYRTKGQPLARPVEVEFHGAQVAQVIARLDETAKEIHQLYKLRPKALDLKPSPASCDKYGGCPHKGRCNLGVVERMEALVMSTESIQEMMTRKTAERDAQAAGGVPPLAPPPVQAPPVQQAAAPPVQHVFQIGEQLGATPPGQVMVDHLASLGLSTAQTAGGWVVVALAPPPAPEAQTAAHAHPPAPQAPPVAYWRPGDALNPAQEYLQSGGKPLSVVASAADVPPPAHIAQAYDAGGMTEAGTINPPEAPAAAPPSPAHMPPAPPVVDTQAVVDDLTAMDREALKKEAIRLGLVDDSCRSREKSLMATIRAHRAAHGVQPAHMPPAPPIQAAVQAANAPYVAEVLAQAPPMPQAPPPQFQPPGPVEGANLVAPPLLDPAPASGGFTLCVNTHPMRSVGMDVVLFSEVFREVQKSMTTDTNLPDYRMEEYGKGPGRMVAYLEGILGELDLGPHTILVVDSRTVEGSHALPTLERLAGTIFRGF